MLRIGALDARGCRKDALRSVRATRDDHVSKRCTARVACVLSCSRRIGSNGQFHWPQTGQCSSARKATKPHSLQRQHAGCRASARV
ncbi:hypothetical protein BFF94_026250 [Burkholderia catarinensis]|nr:hypothetical protein BFF94_026250 [Burkholderia catarinensis]